MSQCHEHGHHTHGADENADKRKLTFALAIIFVFMIVEIVGGILSGSLALLADAAHMAADAGALALALFAKWLAGRPYDSNKMPYGFKRAGVLAGFVNALTLLFLVGWLVLEAGQRLISPHEILTSQMLMVAVAGLIANIAAFAILHSGDSDDINMRGATLHVLSDIFGSIAAILSALIIRATGWLVVDPLLTLVVCALILRSTWPLAKQATHILLQGAPPGFDAQQMREEIHKDCSHIEEITKLHLWMLTSKDNELNLEIIIRADGDPQVVLMQIKTTLKQKFNIEQSTIQINRQGALKNMSPAAPLVTESTAQRTNKCHNDEADFVAKVATDKA